MTVSGLAKLLKNFHIKPKQYRLGDDRHRGYEPELFKDAFSRYLPAVDNKFNRDNVTKAANMAISVFQPVTLPERVTDTNQREPAADNSCHAVTDGMGQ